MIDALTMPDKDWKSKYAECTGEKSQMMEDVHDLMEKLRGFFEGPESGMTKLKDLEQTFNRCKGIKP